MLQYQHYVKPAASNKIDSGVSLFFPAVVWLVFADVLEPSHPESSFPDLEEYLEPRAKQREMSLLYSRGKCKGRVIYYSFNQPLQQPVHTVTKASGAITAMPLIYWTSVL